MNGGAKTTITVSRVVKDRFLAFVGAPKRYPSADEALVALLNCFERREKKKTTKEDQDHGAEPS